jgi:MoxR-like ATPase
MSDQVLKEEQEEKLIPLSKSPSFIYQAYKRLYDIISERVVGNYNTKVAVILGLVTGFPTLLIGDKGGAKTLLIEEVSRHIAGVRPEDVFVRQLDPTMSPEDIFGTINVKEARETGKKVIDTERRLPEAKIVFLDELFLAGGHLRSSLFRALNERKFDNGVKEITTPWIAWYSASNAVSLENPSDSAFLDRFVVKAFQVNPPLTADSVPFFLNVILTSANTDMSTTPEKPINVEEIEESRKIVNEIVKRSVNEQLVSYLIEVVNKVLEKSKFDQDFFDAQEFYTSLGKYFVVSPRTIARMMTVAGAIAFLSGRDRITPKDVALSVLFTLPVTYSIYQRALEVVREAFSSVEDDDTVLRNILSLVKTQDPLMREVLSILMSSKIRIDTGGNDIVVTAPRFMIDLAKAFSAVDSPSPMNFFLGTMTASEFLNRLTASRVVDTPPIPFDVFLATVTAIMKPLAEKLRSVPIQDLMKKLGNDDVMGILTDFVNSIVKKTSNQKIVEDVLNIIYSFVASLSSASK